MLVQVSSYSNLYTCALVGFSWFRFWVRLGLPYIYKRLRIELSTSTCLGYIYLGLSWGKRMFPGGRENSQLFLGLCGLVVCERTKNKPEFSQQYFFIEPQNRIQNILCVATLESQSMPQL
mmetsp:Transcript_3868/g.8528  ORF Transcript_3868/g.8528 Transcript_3868/m.8528 type:complete len:120 (-) Transcript_3868:958-1317(-)